MSKTPAPPTAPSARSRILDAAESRLLKHGPTGLVLDAVAKDAEVSKGGLLYHFASKEALIEGLCERMLDGFERVQDELALEDDREPGRWTRAYLASTVDERGEPADASARLMAGLLAGLGGDTSRLDAVRTRFAGWQRRLEADGVDPVEATIVRLAADGLWLAALLGLPPLEPELRTRVLAALGRRTRPSQEDRTP
ncbi:MAG: TetR/AcrR family transcriptional regulator [Myxococcota bacterium]